MKSSATSQYLIGTKGAVFMTRYKFLFLPRTNPRPRYDVILIARETEWENRLLMKSSVSYFRLDRLSSFDNEVSVNSDCNYK